MPVHDWTRVDAGIFHDFEMSWAAQLSSALNVDALPETHYALTCRNELGFGGDDTDSVYPEPQDDCEYYASRRRRVVISRAADEKPVATIEVVAPPNKASRAAMAEFIRSSLSPVINGIHVLLIDLLPSDSTGTTGVGTLHCEIWEYLTDQPGSESAAAEPGLASYRAGDQLTLYAQPITIGSVLPEMPLFLMKEHYVNIPLEETYTAAYRGVPRRFKQILEAGS